MKLYTKTGDKGKTSLIGGKLFKHDLLIETLGAFDEVNSFTGMARAEMQCSELEQISQELLEIQHQLFDCGSDLAVLQSKNKVDLKVTSDMITWLEQRIDNWVEQAPPIKRFILPGGSKATAALHVCRTSTRRAERNLSRLQSETNSVPAELLAYTNRLSDYFFAVARAVNAIDSNPDIEYVRGSSVFSFSEDKNK
ncbi:cob(I)yrinic acid a,c-diamide adenosyltransferase [Alkalicoccobacillus porphyridii]|uniref:Corrinoid adenosyltransferase n=1 Tax=Alkalicoccobacillus porphyridii TaxID=2597270 RepID=A0A553ZZJ8_9BACI|nr:cob(I)yrinic acid a,c-diamide adenosyltransferase [Alkalicoccobacillus porphyridii]TSB46869.1 cob(I)yrinic acid a,c-diamide adenosyltransferase [Alkalicoccobacillus porphyridii]